MKTVDPLQGMSAEIREQFAQLSRPVQESYMTFYRERLQRKAAHRDTLEAFVAGWHARSRSAVHRKSA
jgi:hypothetical protein